MVTNGEPVETAKVLCLFDDNELTLLFLQVCYAPGDHLSIPHTSHRKCI